MKNIYKKDGIPLTTHEEIERDIFELYDNLMRKVENNMEDIDIVATREGTRLTNEQRYHLEEPATEAKIFKVLKDIGYLMAPRVDGYVAKYFKAT